MATRRKIKSTASPASTTPKNARLQMKLAQKITMFFLHHLQAAVSSVGRFWRTPLASGLTVLVIAIALALPAGLYVVVENVTQITAQWKIQPQISLFMQPQWPEHKTLALMNTLKNNSDIANVEYISAAQGWDSFRQSIGMDDILGTLPENPLPAVLVVTPRDMNQSSQLVTKLQKLAGVEFAQLDSEWVERLQGFLKLGQQSVWMLEIFLGMAVFLMIGNTIRLMLANRQAEIEIMQWVGATPAFIRRPYLYTGMYYGVLGAFVAWIIVAVALAILGDTAGALLASYNSQFNFTSAGLSLGLNLILLGAAVGWLSAYLVAQYYLRQGRPSSQ